jgi:hypothetical protein
MERTIKVKELQMLCGSYEAAPLVYKKLIGKSGKTWLVPTGRFPADNIHVSGDSNSQGYGGSTLTFALEDGSRLDLKGPWHCNSHDLFLDTGLDIRDRHATRVVIAEKAEYEKGEYKPTLSGILHEDLDFQESNFHRGTDLAKELANKLGKSVYYHVLTGGGSHAGWKKPEEKK